MGKVLKVSCLSLLSSSDEKDKWRKKHQKQNKNIAKESRATTTTRPRPRRRSLRPRPFARPPPGVIAQLPIHKDAHMCIFDKDNSASVQITDCMGLSTG